jgi:2-oxoglutarate dehydrogenase E2 component (dihydrolipoamide succinyltransferase)
MALVEVKVPQLSESVAEATLLQWKKKPGDAVAMDEILIEIETDKVVLEVPAPAAGVLGQIIKGDGATVVAGEVIAAVDTDGKAATPAPAAAPKPAAAPTPAAAAGVAMPAAAKRMADAGLPP